MVLEEVVTPHLSFDSINAYVSSLLNALFTDGFLRMHAWQSPSRLCEVPECFRRWWLAYHEGLRRTGQAPWERELVEQVIVTFFGSG